MLEIPKLTERQLKAVNEYVSTVIGFPVEFEQAYNRVEPRAATGILLQTAPIRANTMNTGVFRTIIETFQVYVNLHFYEKSTDEKGIFEFGGEIALQYKHHDMGGNGCRTPFYINLKIDMIDPERFDIQGQIATKANVRSF
jgi:hypothetical protein